MSGNGDYISWADAIDALYKDAEAHPDHTFWTTQHKALRNIPAADVRPKWIGVDDALPELHDAEYLDEVTGEVIHYKESEPILIWLAKGGFMDIGIYEKSDSVDDFCYQGVPHTVTYWMPLPPAPEEKADA